MFEEEKEDDVTGDERRDTFLTMKLFESEEDYNRLQSLLSGGKSITGDDASESSVVQEKVVAQHSSPTNHELNDLFAAFDEPEYSFSKVVDDYSSQAAKTLVTNCTERMITRSDDRKWKVNISQPRARKGTFNFNTLFCVTVTLNGSAVSFQPYSVGFHQGSLVNLTDIPQESAESWTFNGKNTYNCCAKGYYFAILQVQVAEGSYNLGLVCKVKRTTQENSSGSQEHPLTKYSWFEIGEVDSFDANSIPQLLSLWNEQSLGFKDNCVKTIASKPDNKAQTKVVKQTGKRNYKSTEENQSKKQKQ